ncbi:divergent PAP2 family protein [Kineothrix sp. MB12-C1]|uniref:divergent PAP2 family protein n=1 Tax=Kineothrix sp. MB12-C1 TaxID=3070215 RepID=UPI0027D1EEF2|nr:divergent PAP2 family protein [Kineothrix sp. MB12-C1]WMC94491.1 divergent PAP2 family protein [Kineothrix sp. MB12-C1]
MEFLTDLVNNRIFMASVTGWLVAQVLKTLIYMWFNRKFVAERLVGSGGMPSSHSSTVCALVTATGFEYGGGSFPFAIAAIFAIIVMYDAMGVRRETGIQAKVLNEMMELFMHMGKEMSVEEKLKEFVGHTPLQVLMGALLGIIIAVLMYI